MSIAVTASEFEQEVQRGLKRIAGRTRMKGFRPGKTPIKVVEKQYGEQVRQEAAQQFVQRGYQKAIEDHELKPAAHPRIPDEALKVAAGEAFNPEFDVPLRPTFELGEYKELPASSQPITVEDEEVERALTDLRAQQSRTEAAGDDGLPEDGMALCKVVLEHEGKTITERDGLRLVPTHPPVGIEAEAFKQAIVGARDDTELEVAMTFPDEFPTEEVRGQQGVCKIHVRQAFKVSPPTDEEICQMLEVEDLDAVRGKIRERIEEAKQQQEQTRIETELLTRVLDSHPMEVSDSLIDDQARGREGSLREQLSQQGLSEEDLEAEVAKNYPEMRESSAKALRAIYLIEAIAEKEEIRVTDEDMKGELAHIAERNGVSMDEVIQYYREENLLQQLALELLERKVRTLLRETAVIS